MVDETEPGKGRATPSRKEAEAARKKQMKGVVSRKDQSKRDRAAREATRVRQREAMTTGDDRYLPARERGPVRRMCRDYVDRRWNVAEFLLPILVVILILSFLKLPAIVFFLWSFVIVGSVFDEFLMIRGLRKELRKRFEKSQTKGAVAYAVLRSTQLRRFRLPKVQLRRGEPLPDRY